MVVPRRWPRCPKVKSDGGAAAPSARRRGALKVALPAAFGLVALLLVLAWLWASYYGLCLAAAMRRARAAPPPRACPVARAPPHSGRRIAILTLREAAASTARYRRVAGFAAEAEANKARYAAARGYGFVAAAVGKDPVRPVPWAKFPALKRALDAHDWVMYLDGDALVVNASVRVECAGLVDDRYDLVMAQDWSGYNTGVFLVRNSSFARWLLDAMWRTADAPWNLAAPNPWYRHALPFEYEQRALHFMTDTDVWQSAVRKFGVPRYRPNPGEPTAEQIRRHIK